MQTWQFNPTKDNNRMCRIYGMKRMSHSNNYVSKLPPGVSAGEDQAGKRGFGEEFYE